MALTVSTAARMATRGRAMPMTCARSIAFCTMPALSASFGADVDGGIGHQQRARIVRHVHEIDMADAGALCAARSRTRRPACISLIGVQIALHQSATSPARASATAAGRGGMGVRRVDQAQSAISLPPLWRPPVSERLARSGWARSAPPSPRRERPAAKRRRQDTRPRSRPGRRPAARARIARIASWRSTSTRGSVTRRRRIFSVGARV